MNLTHTINKPLDFVFDYLTNMQKFVSIHPVITKIEDKGSENYLVHETLNYGFPISFTYSVKIEKNKDQNSVVMTATVMKFTKVEMIFKLFSENDSTRIEETVNFNTIFPMKQILQKIFKKQHVVLFKNLEAAK